MGTAQPSIFVEGHRNHYALEYEVRAGARDADIRTALAALMPMAGSTDTFAPRLVVGFGADLWARLVPQSQPDGLRTFETIKGWRGTRAIATQRDIWVWIQGPHHDDNFDRALAVQRALSPIAEVKLDQAGFVYRDSRDLNGFVVGSANPKEDARFDVALVPRDRPGGGGSYVLTQRWAHDLDSFNALPVAEQERVIGRTKADNVELEGDVMPADSHVSRTDVSENGVALKIYRRSFPYGGVGEKGLYFIAFACDLHRITAQLERMYGVTDDAIHDRLTEFSQALTGSYWFVPSLEDLSAAVG